MDYAIAELITYVKSAQIVLERNFTKHEVIGEIIERLPHNPFVTDLTWVDAEARTVYVRKEQEAKYLLQFAEEEQNGLHFMYHKSHTYDKYWEIQWNRDV